MFHQIIYTSHSSVPLTRTELVELLDRSRRNNARVGVTGLLLHADGSFMQTIEGESDAVRALLARIERDPRHAGMIMICDEPIQKRSYGDWSMAFREITPEEAARLPGFRLKQACIRAQDRDVARILMQSFIKNARLG